MLFRSDESIDMVVSSSALHHADNLEAVLTEIYRVLNKGGYFIILNETPFSNFRYIISLIKYSMSFFISTLKKKYTSLSANISANSILYDPYLGDKSIPKWYWKKCIMNAGFKILELNETKFTPNKGQKKGIKLTNIICHKE